MTPAVQSKRKIRTVTADDDGEDEVVDSRDGLSDLNRTQSEVIAIDHDDDGEEEVVNSRDGSQSSFIDLDAEEDFDINVNEMCNTATINIGREAAVNEISTGAAFVPVTLSYINVDANDYTIPVAVIKLDSVGCRYILVSCYSISRYVTLSVS